MTMLLALVALAGCGKGEEAAKATGSVATPTGALPATAAVAALAAGKQKFTGVCAGCHGVNAEGQGTFPKLAGKTAEEIAGRLKDYRAGKQVGARTAIMAPMAQGLSDADIDALARYIAGLHG